MRFVSQTLMSTNTSVFPTHQYPQNLLIQLQTPELSCIGFSDHTALGVHLKISKIQDIERIAGGMEAHIYGPCKRTLEDCMQAPVGRIDACHRASNTWSGRCGHGYFVAEQSHKNLPSPPR